MIVISLMMIVGRGNGSSGSGLLLHVVIAVVGLIVISGAIFLPRRRRHRNGYRVHASTEDSVENPHAADASDLEISSTTTSQRLHDTLVEPGVDSQETVRQMSQLDRALEVGVVVTDERGRPQLIGDRARGLLGLVSSAAIEHETPEALDSLSETAARVAQTGEPSVMTVGVQGSDRPAHLEATAVPATGDGDGSVVVQLRNLENVRSLRRNLLEAARLRVLTRLYLGVAHDLRAPINAIMLNLTNLKDSLLEEEEIPGVEHRRTIEMVEDELRRLQRAVESILGQAAPFATEPSTFDVRNLIEDLEFLLRAQAGQQRIDLVVNLPRQPAFVRAPRDAIRQAVLNVVVNAFDAVSERGKVEVRVVSGPDGIDVMVSDSGDGILGSIASHLFEMHATTKDSGSGIGLFVARSAVEAAGGSLELVQTGPEGTVFVIRLPKAEGDLVGQET